MTFDQSPAPCVVRRGETHRESQIPRQHRLIRPCISGTFFAPGGNTAFTERISMWFELLNLIIGIAFGYFHHGKEDYAGLLKHGALAGLLMGIIFVLAARYLIPGGMSIAVGFPGVFGVFVQILIFLIIFIIGSFIGDKLEDVLKK
jgi:hypothetical protein